MGRFINTLVISVVAFVMVGCASMGGISYSPIAPPEQCAAIDATDMDFACCGENPAMENMREYKRVYHKESCAVMVFYVDIVTDEKVAILAVPYQGPDGWVYVPYTLLSVEEAEQIIAESGTE